MPLKHLFFILFCFLFYKISFSQSYPPAAGEPGSTAIEANSVLFVEWATSVSVERGFLNIADPNFEINGNNRASHGIPENAFGMPNLQLVSLGDGGIATVTFDTPITDGPGFDFAVFENSFSDSYLELAFVEVSSNGLDFFRFPSHSLTPSEVQVGGFGNLDPTHIDNLAGKYRGLFGTPFDLADLEDHSNLDKERITHLRIIDVVGSIDPGYATFDSYGNIINDPYPTPVESGGFDLDGVGVINSFSLGGESVKQPQIVLHPNPATDAITISGLGEPCRIEIYSTGGKRLKTSFSSTLPIRVVTEDLASGMYFLLLQTEKKSHLFKFNIK